MSYLTHLLYTSRATVPFTAADVRVLGAASAKRNHSVAVTGLLIYSAGAFLQLLEGRAITLEALMKRIAIDPRHHDVQVLLRAKATQRLLPRWYMGVLNLDTDGTELDRTRMTEVLSADCDEGDSEQRVIAALREFRNQLPEPAL